jgi:hypothetical protein
LEHAKQMTDDVSRNEISLGFLVFKKVPVVRVFADEMKFAARLNRDPVVRLGAPLDK